VNSGHLDPVRERRRFVLRALGRGWRKRCPHCSEGPIFERWARHLPSCSACGLVYERNPGDTWLYTILGDRLPVALLIALVYFGVFRGHRALGVVCFVVVFAAFLWTSPNRWGVGIALHYLGRVYWPDEADPVPPGAGA
jgi:uncharacterized protein (DUF983 family)